MSNECPLYSQPLFGPIRINFYIHVELFCKKGVEKEIVIPLEVFDLYALAIQTLKFFQNRQVIGKGK